MDKTFPIRRVTVTVGIPAYNGKVYIKQAIDSVLSQTFTDFELIVSDDGSTDGTDNICKEYTLKDPRVHFIRHDKNMGGFLNNNYIIKQAEGTYITLLAQDDALENSFLEETVTYLSKHEQCILVSGDFEVIDEKGTVITLAKLEKVRSTIKWPTRRLEFFRYPISKTFFCIYGLMQSKVLKEIYANMPYPKKIFKGSEMPLLARLATRGEITSLPIVLRKYRQHNQSAYNIEFKNTQSVGFFRRRFILLKNLYSIRSDQMKVLWCSRLPLFQKIHTTTLVYFEYLKELLMRIARIPKKFFK